MREHQPCASTVGSVGGQRAPLWLVSVRTLAGHWRHRVHPSIHPSSKQAATKNSTRQHIHGTSTTTPVHHRSIIPPSTAATYVPHNCPCKPSHRVRLSMSIPRPLTNRFPCTADGISFSMRRPPRACTGNRLCTRYTIASTLSCALPSPQSAGLLQCKPRSPLPSQWCDVPYSYTTQYILWTCALLIGPTCMYHQTYSDHAQPQTTPASASTSSRQIPVFSIDGSCQNKICRPRPRIKKWIPAPSFLVGAKNTNKGSLSPCYSAGLED